MDAKQLHSRAAALKAAITGLTSQIETLAPQAVNGDARGPQARERIQQFNSERQQAQLDLEVAEAALRSPEYRQMSAFEHKMKRLEHLLSQQFLKFQQDLRATLSNDFYFPLAKGSMQLANLTVTQAGQIFGQRVTIDELPYAIASGLTGQSHVAERLASFKQGALLNARADNSRQISELTIELELRSKFTQELLEKTPLPEIPPQLLAKLKPQRRPAWGASVDVVGFNRD